jgi:UDP-N-acetylmuramoylalanine--D-glutamate ligase
VHLLEVCPDALTQPQVQKLQAQGIQLRIGPHRADDFAWADVVILSPGVGKHTIASFLPYGLDLPVISELELALGWIREPIIAVTGTNGKTTTVSLIDHILTSCGVNCFTGGNIGTPLSEYVLSGQGKEVVVLEVSSFQLQLTRSLQPNVAVWLNFSPNHLDHHQDLEEYRQAKMSLFANQGPKDIALIHAGLRSEIQKSGKPMANIEFFDHEHSLRAPRLPGVHNWINMEAAYRACAPFGVSLVAAQKAVSSYVPHAHRLQPVTEKDGVLYVNDSKATTVHALQAALQSFDRPIHLLAGGRYKGGDLSALTGLVGRKVRSVTLFGQSREIFSRAWGEIVPIDWKPTLEEAVVHAAGLACSGDVVLLSPATSSFDLFVNYAARGEAFVQAVHDL